MADGFGVARHSCGDSIEIWLKVQDEVVTEAFFWTEGCSPVIACGSIATELIKGKRVTEALKISSKDICQALEDLPEGEEHCAQLAALAIREAIIEYLGHKREPWKRFYRWR